MPESIIVFLLISFVHSVIAILLVGGVGRAALMKGGYIAHSDFPTNALMDVAIWLIFSSVEFIAFYKFGLAKDGQAYLFDTLLLQVIFVVIVVFIVRPFEQISIIYKDWINYYVLFLIPSTLVIGGWAFLHFPHTLDSGQLLWTQEVLWGRTGPIESMIGFSGLIAPLGAAFPDIPLVTIAASFKPVLMVIVFLTCLHAAWALDLRHRLVNSTLLAFLMLASIFGLYGIIELGKDSIYGVLFSIVFMITLCRPDIRSRGVEAALFFSAAAIMGVVTVPYMLIALGLWLAFAATASQGRSVVFSLLIVNAVTLPVVIAGMIRKPYWLLLAAYGVSALLALGGLRLVDRFGASLGPWRKKMERLLPGLPLLLVILGMLLLPAVANITAWVNADGSAVVEKRSPLDGNTGFLDLMFIHGNPVARFQVVAMAVGLVVLLLMGLSRRVSSAKIAVAAMPLAAVVVVLIHLHLGLHLLSPFNQWDMVKDIPLWYGGALFSVFVVGGLDYVWDRVPRRFAGSATYPILTVLVAGSVLFIALPRFSFARYVSSTHYTSIGGSVSEDMALASEQVWRKLRGRNLFISDGILTEYFYSFQMYGARPSRYDDETLGIYLKDLGVVGFAVPQDEVFFIRQFAQAHKARLEYLATLPDSNGVMLRMTFDGTGEITLPSTPRTLGLTASIKSGAYDVETAQQGTFRWFRKQADVRVALANGVACVTLKAFGGQDGISLSVETDGTATPSVLPIAGGSIPKPREVSFTVRSTGTSTLVHLVASTAEFHFPNDGRSIAWGGIVPIAVAPGELCPDSGAPKM